MEDQASLRMRENADAANGSEITPMSPDKSPKSGNMKSWLKSKFAKRNSKIEKPSPKTSPKESPKEEGFVGGAAFTGASMNNSTVSLGAKSSSVRDVALAGKEKEIDAPVTPPSVRGRAGRSESRASTVSSLSDEEEFLEAKDHFDAELTPPQPKFAANKAHSPARDSKFKEIID